ncbi:hypothetical protein ElyMa_003379000 [Elysia marginata]|uniref:Uncharacterized protein n=1 Tax=Elysia marginata TaxID=1093978 RepID=A0AAV4JQ07_9GAST|nr:hypothetical protein ElyMa_003379000 [Elysia marginata]
MGFFPFQGSHHGMSSSDRVPPPSSGLPAVPSEQPKYDTDPESSVDGLIKTEKNDSKAETGSKGDKPSKSKSSSQGGEPAAKRQRTSGSTQGKSAEDRWV